MSRRSQALASDSVSSLSTAVFLNLVNEAVGCLRLLLLRGQGVVNLGNRPKVIFSRGSGMFDRCDNQAVSIS